MSPAGESLPGEQVVCATASECASRLADALLEQLRGRLSAFPAVHLALSGASSGKLLAETLARKPGVSAAEWARIHIWLVDERCVPPEDSRLNFAMIRDALLGNAPIPAGSLHAMPVLLPDGPQRYESELRAALAPRPEGERWLDAAVLGVGPDGHTASLFPGSPALDERERWIVSNDGEQVAPPRPRMTMTYPFINQARLIAVLATGESKRPALRRVLEQKEDYRTLPIAGVRPAGRGRMIWFLDRAAAP